MLEKFRFDHEKHVELWDWLSKHPDKEKEEWPGWGKYGYTAIQYCYACDCTQSLMDAYADMFAEGMTCGDICPLEWNGPTCRRDCYGHDGLYTRWVWEVNPDKRAALAKVIRDLPVNDKLARAWAQVAKKSA